MSSTHHATTHVAVVCSALSSRTKSQGTTSRLLLAFSEALHGREAYEEILRSILAEHLQYGSETFSAKDIYTEYAAAIQAVMHDLHGKLDRIRAAGHADPHEEDAIIATGEVLSCLYIVALIREHGHAAHLVDLSNVLPNPYDKQTSNPLLDLTACRIADRVSAERSGSIPIITGAFGAVPGGLLSTIGRGYTDLCAALLAVGLRAAELQIWKEVDGIFTADPNKVAAARLQAHVTPDEVAAMTARGAEVVHAMVIRQTRKHGIPVSVRNVQKPAERGTRVCEQAVDFSATKSRSAAVGVTSKHNITILRARNLAAAYAKDIVLCILSYLRRMAAELDFVAIDTNEATIGLATNDDSMKASEKLVQRLRQEFVGRGSFNVEHSMNVVSLIAASDRRREYPLDASARLATKMTGVQHEVFEGEFAL